MAQVSIHEVGPRDGLQMEARTVPLALKEAWIRALLGTGVDLIQVGSFVHPGKVPQLADTDELFRRLGTPGNGTVLSGLVLNERGLERAMACGVGLICMGVSASDTHSRNNTGMGTRDAQRRILAMAGTAQAAGLAVQVSVQSAFGCGFEGPIAEGRVLDLVRAYLEAGLTGISLADTAGHAHPEQVKRLFGALLGLAPGPATAHFHDTYGLGMANIQAALEIGVTRFESSFAGLGGCPFAKVADGNVATEDLVHSLQRSGRRTDIDLLKLVGIAQEVAGFFDRPMPGRVHRSGPVGY